MSPEKKMVSLQTGMKENKGSQEIQETTGNLLSSPTGKR